MTRLLILLAGLSLSFAHAATLGGQVSNYAGGAGDLRLGAQNDAGTDLTAATGTIDANGRFSLELPTLSAEKLAPLTQLCEGVGAAGVRAFGWPLTAELRVVAGGRGVGALSWSRDADGGVATVAYPVFVDKAAKFAGECVTEDGAPRKSANVTLQEGWNAVLLVTDDKNNVELRAVPLGAAVGLEWHFEPGS